MYHMKNPHLQVTLSALAVLIAGGSLIYAINRHPVSTAYLPAASSQVAQVAAPTSGLVGYWALDSGSASDSAGSANGSLVGGPTSATGRVGGALSFNGTSQRVSFGSDPIGTGDLTVCAWVNPT